MTGSHSGGMVAVMRPRRAAALAVALCAVSASGWTASPFTPGFKLLKSAAYDHRGGTVATWTIQRDRRDTEITLVMATAPARRARLEVRPVLRDGPARPTYAEGPCQDALAVVNGSFFYKDEQGARPMGLVRVDGQTVQGPSPRTSGGFLTSDGRTLRIVPKRTPAPALAARFAVESAPILIEAGASGMRSNDGQRYDRVAVGVTRDGDLIAVGAFAAGQATVSLWEFEKLAREAARRQGDEIVDLIAMDGGPSAHFYVPDAPKQSLHGWLGRIYTPNVVCIGVRGA